MHLDITVEYPQTPEMATLLGLVGDIALTAEGLRGAYQAGLVFTDDEGIAEVNAAQRGIDRPTDVLSFPSVRYPSGTARDYVKRLQAELDVETGCMHLGDIMISIPRAAEQAQAYGHALLREVSFLFVHGLLHLMGYDHMDETERTTMRKMEEQIMDQSGISRALSDEDIRLVACAKEAVSHAYTPYSHYKVGACLRTTDGQLVSGCNVENASYGLTICAERNALTTAVMQGMRGIEAIAIAGHGAMPYPCGACRQFMREFGKDVKVIITNDERTEVTTLEALLPESFGPESLLGEDA